MKLKESVIVNLYLLMSVFILGYGFIVGIHLYFTNVVVNLDNQIKNEQARYKIGEYILAEINGIESNFYKMSLSHNEHTIKPIKMEIKEEISDIKKAIEILENGGTLEDYIKLNIVGLEKINEYIVFKPNRELHYTFEAIDILPKLTKIEEKLDQLDQIIVKKNKLINSDIKEEKFRLQFEVQMFFKQIPPMFIRMKENTSRLLYESRKNTHTISTNIESKKEFYHTLQFILTLSIMLLVLTLGYIITKQIKKNSDELKKVTEQANKSAIEALNANKVKSQFLANMSHEIRTPLNAIIGFSEVLAQGDFDKKEKEHASIILKSAKSLLYIINDILDISKVESGKFELIKETFDSRAYFEQIVELFSVNAKDKNIRFLFDYSTSIPPYLFGDSTRLKQVISNLLSNAIKFTPQNKHVTFSVKLIQNNQETVSVHFSVEDEGIGISQENLKNIFLPFSQADSSTSRAYGGTGLGLTISSKIIELMGSKIMVESEKDRGSKFYFNLEFEVINKVERRKNKKLNYTFAVSSYDSNDEEHIKTNLLNYLDELGELHKLDELKSLDEKISVLFYFGELTLLEKVKQLKQKHDTKIVYVGNPLKISKFQDIIDEIDYYLDVPIYGSKVFNIISTACKIDKQQLSHIKIETKFEGNILVAEDNRNNQKLIEILLQKLNLDCKIANDGQEALDEYLNNDYDLILMDINMPIMDGLTSLAKIKVSAKYQNSPIPVIALTANTIKGDREKYLQSGMDNYLSKPIEMKELIYILQQYLKEDESSIESKNVIVLEDNNNNSITEVKEYKKEHTINQIGLGEAIVDKLLTKFLESLDDDIKRLEDAINSKDRKEIFEAAHYLKGPCANFAMKYAVDLLMNFEEIAKNNIEKTYNIDELKSYFDSVKKELKV